MVIMNTKNYTAKMLNLLSTNTDNVLTHNPNNKITKMVTKAINDSSLDKDTKKC